MHKTSPDPLPETDLGDQLSRNLADQAVEARCTLCGTTEWVIPLDLPIDDLFLANYDCDDCEGVAEV
jgi:hypothetical protein